jgi:Flp pilus assembly protein TadG
VVIHKITTLSHLFRSLHGDQCGVSAVEFAMLLPLMLLLYVGGNEISQGIAINRKVILTSRTVADLASQATSISSADMANILSASAAVMAPYDVTNLKVTVSEIDIDGKGKATIAWSCTLSGTTHPAGSSVILPESLKVPNTSLVWGEAAYAYTPIIGFGTQQSFNLPDHIYMRPRQANSIEAAC